MLKLLLVLFELVFYIICRLIAIIQEGFTDFTVVSNIAKDGSPIGNWGRDIVEHRERASSEGVQTMSGPS